MAERGLIDLLDAVHQALRNGTYSELGPLTAELDLRFGARAPDLSPQEAELVRRKAQRNAACLQGAQRGFRSARRRLAEIASASSGLVTYDTRGNLIRQTADPRLAKRF